MIDGMVRLAEHQSYMTCEYCGTTENVGHTQGWISTICKTCHSKIDNRKDLKWKPVGQSLYED
jgi:UTP-glucose-1-phosphate uridylyltransferase